MLQPNTFVYTLQNPFWELIERIAPPPWALVAQRGEAEVAPATKLRRIETRVFPAGESIAVQRWLTWRQSRSNDGTIALVCGTLHPTSWRQNAVPRPQDVAKVWAFTDLADAAVPPSVTTAKERLYLLGEPVKLPPGMAAPLLTVVPNVLLSATMRRHSLAGLRAQPMRVSS
jgi:hypothetical protein